MKENTNNQTQPIIGFKGKYSFLSNFYGISICYREKSFKNSEAAFQAMKCPDRADEFTLLSARSAWRHGRKVPLRKDWKQEKEQIMYEVCLAKFTQDRELTDLLLATGTRTLVEDNSWNDTEWGMCNGIGKNKLGEILMQIREELRYARLDKVKAHINSLKGQMKDVIILNKKADSNDYIVVYNGVKCHAIFNWFVCEYYADDLNAVIWEEL